eukprot:5027202-Pyramimonas_sp.AAC.1
MRTCSAEDKQAYMALKGKAKTLFRQQWQATKLSNLKGTAAVQERDRDSDVTESWYMNWTNLVIARGGLLDKAAAEKSAGIIAKKCISSGAPYIMYNKWAEELEFLNVRKGTAQSFTTDRVRSMEGEFE